jgi:hypothetical protein
MKRSYPTDLYDRATGRRIVERWTFDDESPREEGGSMDRMERRPALEIVADLEIGKRYRIEYLDEDPTSGSGYRETELVGMVSNIGERNVLIFEDGSRSGLFTSLSTVRLIGAEEVS